MGDGSSTWKDCTFIHNSTDDFLILQSTLNLLLVKLSKETSIITINKQEIKNKKNSR